MPVGHTNPENKETDETGADLLDGISITEW